MSGRRVAVVALCLVGAVRASAQSSPLDEGPAARTITLREALDFAREHQPAVRAAASRVRALEADRNATLAQWLPTIGATAQGLLGTANNTTASYVGVRDIDIPRIGGTKAGAPTDWMPYPSTLVAAGVEQEVFDFGKIGAQADVDAMNVAAQKAQQRAVELDIAANVEEAYFGVAAAHAVVTAAADAYARALVHRDEAALLVKNDLRPRIELTRAETDLARFDVGRVRARGALSIAETELAAAIGANEPRLDIAATDPAVASPAANVAVPTMDDARDDVKQRDPFVLAAQARLKAQQAETKAIEAQALPNLSVTSTISARDGGAPVTPPIKAPYGLLPLVPNYDAGLVLSWPIFDGVIGARADASRLREEERNAELSAVTETEEAAVVEAREAVVIAGNALSSLTKSVEAARANYAQADERFKNGLGTSVELADAEAARTDAEIQLAVGTFDVARARARLQRLLAEGP
jgi:outer membrane protein TolC